MTIDFDSNGTLTHMSYESAAHQIVTIPPLFVLVTMNGDYVVISIDFMGNAVEFNGMLDSDSGVITGKISGSVTLNGMQVDIEEINAELTRQ